MGLSTFLLPILLCNLCSSVLGDDVCLSAGGEKVTVTVKGATTIANTDDPFVCATLDWWPPTKCDYKMCPWGSSSILNLNLENPILLKAVQAFNPLRLRLGGSLQNRLLYNVRNSTQECKPFERSSTGLFGFTEGCLEMERWDKVNEFIGKAGAVVTFGLNALYGRKKPCKDPNDTLWTGAWGSTNAYQFIEYTISKGYKVDSWEFGNELSGIGIKARVEPYQYGKDMILLKQLLKELYKNTSMQAKLLGPGGFFNQTWYTKFLQSSGENVVDAITHHIYNLGPGNGSNLSDKMQDPFYLYNVAQIYSDIQVAAQSFPWASVWMSESGGAYNSGGKESHNFANSFWYLDQLGMTSTFNHKVFCRQSLIGGNYGLLNTTTMVPNPDYYSALLFHRLMGPGVLAISHDGNPYLRAYSHCSREKDVDNPILNNAVKEFGTLRIRIGGSLQDQLLYNVGPSVTNCTHDFIVSPNDLFGYTTGCLTMDRWDKVNQFFNNTGALVTFGLNALYGRNKPTAPGDILWTGNWNSSNARDFIGYTITKGYKIEGWEFGNELCGGGVAAKVDATQYAADMSDLKILLSELYPNPSSLPKLSGPSGFFDREWFVKFVQGMYPDWLDIVSHHIYNLGPGVDPNLVKKMQDPYVLDNTAQTYKDIQLTVQSFSPWSSVWVSESGGAYNNGGKVSHTFVDGFWYMDMLGMTSTFGHQVFCRQSLVGANYGLLNTTTMVPNPDYYSALLFHRLMGRGVLATVHNGSPDLRAYSHCSRTKPGITLLLINLSNSTEFNIDVTSDLNIYAPQDVALPSVGSVGMFGERLEYHLTPKDGDLNSTTVLLNGNPLEVTSSGEIPPMNPAVYNDSNPLTVAPSSIVFVVLSDFKAPACA